MSISGCYSAALGSAKLLSNGNYTFDAGYIDVSYSPNLGSYPNRKPGVPRTDGCNQLSLVPVEFHVRSVLIPSGPVSNRRSSLKSSLRLLLKNMVFIGARLAVIACCPPRPAFVGCCERNALDTAEFSPVGSTFI